MKGAVSRSFYFIIGCKKISQKEKTAVNGLSLFFRELRNPLDPKARAQSALRYKQQAALWRDTSY